MLLKLLSQLRYSLIVITGIDSFSDFANGDVGLANAHLAIDSGLPVEAKHWDRFLFKLDIACSSHLSLLTLLSLEFLVELLSGIRIDFSVVIRISIHIMGTICVGAQNMLTLLHDFLSKRESRSTSVLAGAR